MNIDRINPQQLIECLQEGIVVHDASTQILYANPKALEILRMTEAQILGKAAVDPEWRFINSTQKLMAHQDYPVNRVITSRAPVNNLEVGVCDSSSEFITWVLCNAYPNFDESGEIDNVVVTFQDITSRKLNIPFDSIVAHANDLIIVTEAEPLVGDGPRIVYVNQAFCELTGYTADEVLGQTPRILQREGTSQETRSRIHQALLNKQPIRETILNYSKSDIPYWLDLNIFPLQNAMGEVSHFAAVQRNVTDQMKEVAKLQEFATQDALTGLLNRRGLHIYAKDRFAAMTGNRGGTVALIDIDRFKRINDSFGHEAGDEVIQHVARQLRKVFRSSDLLCRFGGEEFLALLPDAMLKDAYRMLENFRESLCQNLFHLADDRTITLTVSIGIAPISTETLSMEAAIRVADKALYEAKNTGRNRTVVAESSPFNRSSQ